MKIFSELELRSIPVFDIKVINSLSQIYLSVLDYTSTHTYNIFSLEVLYSRNIEKTPGLFDSCLPGRGTFDRRLKTASNDI